MNKQGLKWWWLKYILLILSFCQSQLYKRTNHLQGHWESRFPFLLATWSFKTTQQVAWAFCIYMVNQGCWLLCIRQTDNIYALYVFHINIFHPWREVFHLALGMLVPERHNLGLEVSLKSFAQSTNSCHRWERLPRFKGYCIHLITISTWNTTQCLPLVWLCAAIPINYPNK